MKIINNAPKLLEIAINGKFLRLMPDDEADVDQSIIDSGRLDFFIEREWIRIEPHSAHQKRMKIINSKAKTPRWFDGKNLGDLETGRDYKPKDMK